MRLVLIRGSFLVSRQKRSTKYTKHSSRNKRVPRRVAEDPERKHGSEQQPNVCRLKLIALYWTLPDNRVGISNQCIQQKRQRYYKQWIQLKGAAEISVQQMMQATRTATPGTGKSRECTERTAEEEAGFTRLKKIKVDRPEGQ